MSLQRAICGGMTDKPQGDDLQERIEALLERANANRADIDHLLKAGEADRADIDQLQVEAEVDRHLIAELQADGVLQGAHARQLEEASSLHA